MVPFRGKKSKQGGIQMPLTLAEEGVENIIKRVGGSPEVKKHL